MSVLERVKEGPSQTQLNVAQRRANVRDAFRVSRI